eukprot:9875060-Heterocapsa_arctica.AAC.1
MLYSNRPSHRGSRAKGISPTSYVADPHNKGGGYFNTCKSQEQGHESQPKDDLKAHTDRHQ